MLSFESIFEIEVLRGLLKRSDYQEEYFKMFYSKLEPKVFTEKIHQDIFKVIQSYVKKYPSNKAPSLADIKVYMSEVELYNSVARDIMNDDINSQSTFNKLVDDTKEWIKNNKLKLLIREASERLERKETLAETYDEIGKALNVTYDNDLGLSSESSMAERLKTYQQRVQASIITGIPSLDEMLGGGFQNKTLNLIGAPTHGGKSLMLSHITAVNYRIGKNCVYITLEMPENEIYKRIDANMLEMEIVKLGSNAYEQEILDKYKALNNLGRLFIKEYSAGSCSVNTIAQYLEDIYKQKDFKPNLLCVDYLTLMRSDRSVSSSNMYEKGKAIAEELHGLAKQLNIPILTAVQLNRQSVGNVDSEINAISESFGIAQTSDTMISLLRDISLKAKGRVLAKINKNRNTGILQSTEIIMEAEMMRFRDVENSTFINNLNANPKSELMFTSSCQSDFRSWWREGD